MIVKCNNVQLPVNSTQDLEPISIKAAVSDSNTSRGWLGELNFEIDSGSDCVSIPLPILTELLGDYLKIEETASMVTADGAQSQVAMTKISLRIKTDNGEVICLQDVECAVPKSGTPLLGRNVLNLFKVTLVQGKLQSMYLSPKIASYLGVLD